MLVVLVVGGTGADPGGCDELVAGGLQGGGEAGPIGVSTRTGLDRSGHGLYRFKTRLGGVTCGFFETGQAACRYSLIRPRAPRGALLYPRLSREELGGRFLGPMADLEPKG